MKDKHFIIIVVGYACTLLFELGGYGIRRDWFLGTDLVYPNLPNIWGLMAGQPALTLQHYLDDIGEHLHNIALYTYILINARHDQRFFFYLSILFGLSLVNYMYNYHEPLIWKFDLNYFILGFMVLFLISKGKNWWK